LNSIASWLREANSDTNIESLIMRCHAAANEIEKQESIAAGYRLKMAKVIDEYKIVDDAHQKSLCYKIKSFFKLEPLGREMYLRSKLKEIE